MTTTAGKALIRDVLVLAHRTPLFWTAGPGRPGARRGGRARSPRRSSVNRPTSARYVDQQVSQRVETNGAIGPVVLDRLVDEAMLRLHAEERELDQLEALDKRHVTVDEASINHNGIGDLDARMDWADLAASDASAASQRRSSRRSRSDRHESEVS